MWWSGWFAAVRARMAAAARIPRPGAAARKEGRRGLPRLADSVEAHVGLGVGMEELGDQPLEPEQAREMERSVPALVHRRHLIQHVGVRADHAPERLRVHRRDLLLVRLERAARVRVEYLPLPQVYPLPAKCPRCIPDALARPAGPRRRARARVVCVCARACVCVCVCVCVVCPWGRGLWSPRHLGAPLGGYNGRRCAATQCTVTARDGHWRPTGPSLEQRHTEIHICRACARAETHTAQRKRAHARTSRLSARGRRARGSQRGWWCSGQRGHARCVWPRRVRQRRAAGLDASSRCMCTRSARRSGQRGLAPARSPARRRAPPADRWWGGPTPKSSQSRPLDSTVCRGMVPSVPDGSVMASADSEVRP